MLRTTPPSDLWRGYVEEFALIPSRVCEQIVQQARYRSAADDKLSRSLPKLINLMPINTRGQKSSYNHY
ncbi:hypothetical protein FHW17_004832 [Phyllobacterium sp. P30BS-XVII]|nr:hypothetical protein [Phyllobacterium sp. P30BS-XVII]